MNRCLGECKARRFRVSFGIKPLIPKAKPPPPEPTMRQERTVQASIFDLFAGHEIGRELKAMSSWLDQNPALATLAAKDLQRLGGRACLPKQCCVARSSSNIGN